MASTIILCSSDVKDFSVDLNVVAQLKTVSTMIRDLGIDDMEFPMPIPLPNVHSKTLEKILEWCCQHKNDETIEVNGKPNERSCTVPEWDKKFLEVEYSLLLNVLQAANYLDIPKLLDYCCQTLANMIRGKEVEQLRREFNIESDFNQEEYAEIVAAHTWCDN